MSDASSPSWSSRFPWGAAELYPEDDHEEHDDHDEHEEEPITGVLENSFLDNEGGALGASWIGERWRAGLSWTAYDSDYGIPGAHHHEHEEEGEESHDEEHGEEEEELVTVGLESRRWDAEVIGTDPFAGFDQLIARHRDLGDRARDFRRDRHDERIDARLRCVGCNPVGDDVVDHQHAAHREDDECPPAHGILRLIRRRAC